MDDFRQIRQKHTPTALSTLVYLAISAHTSVKALASARARAKSQVSDVLGRLAMLGLVAMAPDGSSAALTPAGWGVVEGLAADALERAVARSWAARAAVRAAGPARCRACGSRIRKDTTCGR
jgi:hypothetical protein